MVFRIQWLNLTGWLQSAALMGHLHKCPFSPTQLGLEDFPAGSHGKKNLP